MANIEFSDAQREVMKSFIDKANVKVVTNFDYKNNLVSYHKDLEGRDIKTLKEEEMVRACFLTKLVNEYGYKIKNIEIERQYKAGRPHTQTNRIDLIVKNKEKNENDEQDAFLFVEIKTPNAYHTDTDEIIESQLFKVAACEEAENRKVKYLVLYTMNVINDELKDECIVIDYEKYHTYKEWEKSRNMVTSIPTDYGKAKSEPYVKGGVKDLETNFTNDLLNSLQSELHNVLWGGGGTDDNDVFSSLTNLILAKIQDENEKDTGEKYDFQCLSLVDEDGNEEFESLEELFNRVNALYRRALKDKLNIDDKDEIEKSFVVDTKKFSLEKVKFTVQKLEKYSFVDGKNSISGKDILGDFFEGIIRDGFKQTKGQFFTHINIVKFMLWAIQADKLAIERINRDKEIPYMIDPSAGSGSFLIEYMKFITENIKYRFRNQIKNSRDVKDKMSEWFEPDNKENKWAREYIYGSELNFNLGTATKVNMILHGDGSTNIFVGTQKGDGLLPFNEYIKPTAPNALNKGFEDKNYKKQINGHFDLILTNPPFSVNLDNETKKKVKNSFIFGEKKNSENLFIERYYQLLKENGRLAAVLPESIFDTPENKYIRLFLYKYFKIKAVVSLPQTTFAPYTNTKTSILFAQKKTENEVSEYVEKWSEYSKEYSNLKTRVENLIKVMNGEKEKSKLPSIKDLTEKEEREILENFLKFYIKVEDSKLTNIELMQKYLYEIEELCKYDKDLVDELGYVNTWWVFASVSKDLDYNIFNAEVDKIGYLRTKRSLTITENDLYEVNNQGQVIVDSNTNNTVLDYIRKIEW